MNSLNSQEDRYKLAKAIVNSARDFDHEKRERDFNYEMAVAMLAAAGKANI